MTNVSLENIKGNAIGGFIAALVMAAFPAGKLFDLVGQPLGALMLLIGAVGVWSTVLVYHRYVQLLGAGGSRKETAARQAYDKLRANLADGGPVGRLYSDRLRRFLDAVDRFFGDAHITDRTLFHRFFWLKTSTPLWTAPALDRCILLALCYPIITIFLCWAMSGHVGPAEKALLLNGDVNWWKRTFAAAALGSAIFTGLQWRKSRLKIAFVGTVLTIGLGIASAGAFGGSAFNSNALAVVAAAIIIMFLIVIFVDVWPGVTAVSVAMMLIASANAIYFFPEYSEYAVKLIVSIVGMITISLIYSSTSTLNKIEILRRNHGLFLALFIILMMIFCLILAHRIAPFMFVFEQGESLLLFLCLLTLINAPFDWASLGLTRALLRRGLELSGWWPLVLALTDAIAAALIISVLAIAMVVGVQTFDELVVHGGGKPVLPLNALFDGITENPSEPEYWWVYSLLLSTMIPSLINLAIGGASLMRAVPGVSSWLLTKMPAGRSVPKLNRNLVALVLTFQIVLGVALGFLMQTFLAWIVVFKAMPIVGLGLLDVAREIAAFNLSARLGQLLGG